MRTKKRFSKAAASRSSTSSALSGSKPLQIDCSSLFNHLHLIQKSLKLEGTSSSSSTSNASPTLQMLNFQSHKHEQLQDWYILVASTPYAISAQLINVPTNISKDNPLPDIIVPDLIQCTPISVWTCTCTKKYTESKSDGDVNMNMNMNMNMDGTINGNGNLEEYGTTSTSNGGGSEREILNCKPVIITQEPSSITSQEYLQVGIIIGTNLNRVLSIQLSIYSYVGFSGVHEGRYVLSKTQKEFGGGMEMGIVEPLPIDTNDDIKRQRKKRERERDREREQQRGSTMEKSGLGVGVGGSSTAGSVIGNGSVSGGGNHNNSTHDSGITDKHSHMDDAASVASGTSSRYGGDVSVHSNTGMSTSTRTNNNHNHTDPSSHEWVPFRPGGGVVSISSLYKHNARLTYTFGEGRNGSSHGHGRSHGSRHGHGHGRGNGNGNHNGEGYFLWITYGDGTLVRLPRWAFFALDDLDDDLMLDSDADVNVSGSTLESSQKSLPGTAVKARIDLNPEYCEGSGSGSGSGSIVIVPLPRFYPTLLSQPLENDVPILPSKPFNEDLTGVGVDEDSYNNNGQVGGYEFYEAVSYKDETNAWRLGRGGGGRGGGRGGSSSSSLLDLDTYPTIAFYTNEDQLFSNTHNTVQEEVESSTVQNLIRGGSTIIGGTAAIAKGVLGGVLRGVLGRGAKKIAQEEKSMNGMEIGGMGMEGFDAMEDAMNDADRATRASMFPVLHQSPTLLSLGTAIYDSPRQITHVSIDPVEGELMACADNLGRVQLIDLATKQVIRMWKGFREASCHWIQFPHVIDDEIYLVKYLAIHSRSRNVVEIYRLSHGPRVGKFDVKSNTSNIVQCAVNLAGGELYERCFLLQKNGGITSQTFIAKELTVSDDELKIISMESASWGHSNMSNSSSGGVGGSGGGGGFPSVSQHSMLEGTIQLQLLKQLLASESAVPSDLDAVYAALTQITAISDLSKALDLLALATHLEDGMGVEGSSFHMEVVLHAEEQLNIAMSDETLATSRNPHLDNLTNKIEFHGQLINAFDEIHTFEKGDYSDNEGDVSVTTPSSWADEAVAWIQTYEDVTERSIDDGIAVGDGTELKFSVFAKGCLQDKRTDLSRNEDGKLKIYLCDSTRDRKQILLHLFRPLTKDIFVFKVTQRIFEHMGINDDYDKLLQYYGEWFMSLPKEVAERINDGVWCPAVRWLNDVVLNYLQSEECEKAIREDGNVIILEALYRFCEEAEDLPRAFLLAVVCHDAIAAATKKIDDKTYGLVTFQGCVKPWRDLLRKLRVCLLVSLRLYGVPLGPLPINVANVEKGDLFSAYQWLAHDEVSLSHKTRDLIGLEDLCRASSLAFNPSLTEGDERWQMLQTSCRERYSIKNFVPAGDDGPGPLLLFLKHYNDSRRLAAHRALVLSQNWAREPEALHLLDDALVSMRSVNHSAIVAATLQEMWNANLRPIYRGLLFGFHEVHEVSEEIINPLCEDKEWFHDFNKICMGLITLLRSAVHGDSDENLDVVAAGQEQIGLAWPPLQKDHIMDHLLARSGTLDDASLEAHRGIICAMQLSEDLSLLPFCVPSFEECFLRNSFSQHITVPSPPNEYQNSFMDSALRTKAHRLGGVTASHSSLEDLVSLGRSWGMDKSRVLTQFLLFMYELGKDEVVEELANSSTRLIEIDPFLDGGVPIVCVRLNAAIIALKKARCRSILAMLDADTCAWVKEQAELTEKERDDSERIQTRDEDGKLISLLSTHGLILRIKRMSTVNRIDAYALSVMCETLLKAVDKTDNLI